MEFSNDMASRRWLAIARRWMDPETRVLTTKTDFCRCYGISVWTLEVWVRQAKKAEEANAKSA